MAGEAERIWTIRDDPNSNISRKYINFVIGIKYKWNILQPDIRLHAGINKKQRQPALFNIPNKITTRTNDVNKVDISLPS